MAASDVICPQCGERHVWLRLNVTIVCGCGVRINRTEQLRQRDALLRGRAS
jgi:hypothetical protein